MAMKIKHIRFDEMNQAQLLAQRQELYDIRHKARSSGLKRMCNKAISAINAEIDRREMAVLLARAAA